MALWVSVPLVPRGSWDIETDNIAMADEGRVTPLVVPPPRRYGASMESTVLLARPSALGGIMVVATAMVTGRPAPPRGGVTRNVTSHTAGSRSCSQRVPLSSIEG